MNNMEGTNLSELTDQELLQEVKRRKSATILDAVIIGFLIGVALYGFSKGRGIFLIFITGYCLFKFARRPKYNWKQLNVELKQRGLK
jgi:hypothetical protein